MSEEKNQSFSAQICHLSCNVREFYQWTSERCKISHLRGSEQIFLLIMQKQCCLVAALESHFNDMDHLSMQDHLNGRYFPLSRQQ